MNDPEKSFRSTGWGALVLYDTVRQAMAEQDIEHYTMSLASEDEIQAVIEAVNTHVIDAHLEACYCPERGDSYERGERAFTATSDGPTWKAGERVVHTHTLECTVSAESLPTLLRRLTEQEYEEDDEAEGLVDSILLTLGIDHETGKYVGREALVMD